MDWLTPGWRVAFGVVCIAVAAVYVLWDPHKRWPAGPVARVVLRWFHPLAWVLLAGFCFAMASGSRPLIAAGTIAAWAALGVYAVYILTVVRHRRRRIGGRDG